MKWGVGHHWPPRWRRPCLNDANVAASAPELSLLVEFWYPVSLDLDVFPESGAHLTFFVNGYNARSISSCRKCPGFNELLVDNYDVPELHTCVPKEHARLFQIADRSGISGKTQLCFAIAGQLLCTSFVSKWSRVFEESACHIMCFHNSARIMTARIHTEVTMYHKKKAAKSAHKVFH